MPAPPFVTLPNGRQAQARETILVYGDSDVGKTFQYLKLADWHQRRGSDARFFGICTPGNDWTKFFLPGAEFEHLANVHFENATVIQDYFDVYDKVIKRARPKPHDWLNVDVLGDSWGAAQEEYAEREWGTDLGSKWATEGGRYPIGGADWPWGSINSRHKAFAQNRVIRFPGHLYCCAWDRAPGEKDDKDKLGQATFGMIGRWPVGQKDEYRRFDTVIHLSFNGRHERVARTAKERGGRRRLGEVVQRGKAEPIHVGEPINDLFKDYLLKIARWKP